MSELQNSKTFDLEERTFDFAKKCRDFISNLPKTINNIEYSKQLARSSGSQAANYIEANESLSKKDFYHRMKICRKESKESIYWLKLLDTNQDKELEKEIGNLVNEATELMKIFSSIMRKTENKI